jgi:hypothetical protein
MNLYREEKKYGYIGKQLKDPLSFIMKRLWRGIHIIGTTFDSSSNKLAFKCFFYSLANLIPQGREYMYQFIKEYPIDNYLSTNSRAFYWTYLLHEFINLQLNKNYSFTFEDAKELYDSDNIDKKIWGNAIWDIIHILAKYIPTDSNGKIPKEAKLIFMDFINCIQKLLPCELCRNHMIINMKKYNIEKYLDNRTDLFTWTVTIHNEVNKDNNKKKMSVKEAWILY